MEKQIKLRNKILKILPRAAAAVTMTFQNPPFSPGRDHHNRHHHNRHHHGGGKGFSGPILPMIPIRKPNGRDRNGIDNNYQEPTSPKISCMGQIKHNKKKQAKKTTEPSPSTSASDMEVKLKKNVSTFQRMMLLNHHKRPKSTGRKSDASAAQLGNKGDRLADRAPNMSEMKPFASGRNTLADFDWKAHHQVVAEEIDDCYSDEGRESDLDEEEEDEDYRIPFSAPILLGGGGGELNLKPRKEINLWKRRTMEPPRPLRLSI